MVFDDWVEMRFAEPQEGQSQVSKASALREIWKELADLRLQETLDEETKEDNSKSADLEMMLSDGLIEFVHTETLTSIRRLLPW